MYWHIDADIISLLVLSAIYVYCERTKSGESALQTRKYLWCLRIGIIVTIIDIAASVIMEVPTTAFLYHVLMTLDFAGMELTIVFWFRYCLAFIYSDNEKRRSRSTRIVEASYIVYALFVVTNPWTGAIYSLDANNVYQRGPLFFLMVGVYAVYALALFMLLLIRCRHLPARQSPYILLATPVIVGVSIAAQLLNAGWLMILPGYMFSMLLAFLFLQGKRSSENQQLVKNLSVAAASDPLTNLYNRAGFEQMTQLLSESNPGARCLVIMADIDGLKDINDSFGHAEGDRAICGVAGTLKNHFRTTDVISRFGGDEFVVYLLGDMTDAQARDNLARLLNEISLVRAGENDEASVCASLGAVFGVVGTDSLDTLCEKADLALYYVKHHGKHGYAFYEPSMENTVFSINPALSFEHGRLNE